ncbi:MAG: DUF4214 domain-containing protein [Oscillospiraceae bacterium]|nr:DUF4214 domain-containing protein [Oscillospiraceae bacterium]
MKYTDDELACRLYGLAAERMQAAGRQMPCSEAVFSVLTAAAPDAVSYRAMETLNNPDFLEAAYLLLLGRPVDAPSLDVWKAQFSQPEQEFRTAVLKTIITSAEYQKHRIPLTGCPLMLAEDEPQQNLLISSQALPERLVKMYQHMPRPLQKLAKKIAGKE